MTLTKEKWAEWLANEEAVTLEKADVSLIEVETDTKFNSRELHVTERGLWMVTDKEERFKGVYFVFGTIYRPQYGDSTEYHFSVHIPKDMEFPKLRIVNGDHGFLEGAMVSHAYEVRVGPVSPY